MPSNYLKTLKRVTDLPTAPFQEAHVVQLLREFVRRRSALRMQADRFGNLLVTYRPPRRRARLPSPPILFAAHTDHPGFRAVRMRDARHVEAEWRGWVSARFFDRQPVQFHVEGRWLPGVITEVIPHPPSKTPKRAASSARSFGADSPPRAVVARVSRDVPPGSIGMWALPDGFVRGRQFHTRACDDLAGVAGILCALDLICRKGGPAPCHALFTRAEEVGFGGALTAVEAGTIPSEALVVAVECSKAIAGVALGDGPVLRVGDKASVFTPALTGYCQVVAEQLAVKDKSFRFQRKLMDGGTCESTVYCHHGYAATGICLPLLNYHNMDAARGRIAAEIIDTRDFANLVKWFVALAQAPATLKYDGRHPGLEQRLEALRQQHRQLLLATVKQLGQ